MQAIVEVSDARQEVLLAMLHAAARLSDVAGQQSMVSIPASATNDGNASGGFHSAQAASLQAFERCLQWPRQWQNDGRAYCAVRSGSEHPEPLFKACKSLGMLANHCYTLYQGECKAAHVLLLCLAFAVIPAMIDSIPSSSKTSQNQVMMCWFIALQGCTFPSAAAGPLQDGSRAGAGPSVRGK